MIAAGAGSVDAVRQLVLHGADVNVAEPRRGQTALMWAAAEGHSEVVSALVEMGANVKAASKKGFTPLIFSTTKNDVASIKALLRAGADPNVTLPSGNKPLMVAMAYRNTQAALALIDGGADVNARDRAGLTSLHGAARKAISRSSRRFWPKVSIPTCVRRNHAWRREGAAAAAESVRPRAVSRRL